MIDIKMQKAEMADLARIVSWVHTPRELLLWAGPSFSFPVQIAEFERNLASEEVNGFVMENAGRIVGYAEINKIDPEQRSAFLCRVIIDPAQRGKGFGAAMINTIKEYCLDERCLELIYLNVFLSNPVAYSIYEKNGFTVMEGKEFVSTFYGEKEAGVRMVFRRNLK